MLLFYFLFFLFLVLNVYCLTALRRDGCCSFLLINLRGHKNRTYYLIRKGKEAKNEFPFKTRRRTMPYGKALRGWDDAISLSGRNVLSAEIDDEKEDDHQVKVQ